MWETGSRASTHSIGASGVNIAEWQVEHARRYADEIALIEGEESSTNAELFEDAARLAHGLLDLGLVPGDRAACALPNCRDLYVAVAAIIHAGLVLVVVPDSTEAEIRRVVKHCGARALVTHSHVAANFATSDSLHVIASDAPALEGRVPSLLRLIAGSPPLASPVVRAPTDPAQLCYTSGTTDAPRAAIYTHAAFDAYLRNRAGLIPDRDRPHALLVALPSTAFGARLIAARVIANQPHVLLERFEPEAALAAIETHRIEAIPLLPTMAEQLVATRPARRYDCTSLRAINISGAHVPASLVTRIKDYFPGHPHVVVHYGMTETGGGIASSETGGVGGGGNVGRVVAGVEVRIVGPDGADVEAGEIGAIIAKTPYAAVGYWNDPQRSASVFRDGYVHTGDLGRLDESGELCVVGREKDLIVQGGFKVLPVEVAHAIEHLPGVASCAIAGVADDLLGEEVVACIVPATAARLSEREVLAHCRKTLDPRKLPGQVLFFDELPRTAAGKFDLAALKADIVRRRADARAARSVELKSVPPKSQGAFVRKQIVASLRAVLPRDPGDVPDDEPLGETGLDSLGAVRLAHRLGEQFALTLPATLIYTYPTVVALAEHIERQVWARPDSSGA